jgi:hypothetical protein
MKLDDVPGSAQRLRNGHTLISTRSRVFEIDADGKEKWHHTPAEAQLIYYARQLPNGRIACLGSEPHEERLGRGVQYLAHLVILEATGKLVEDVALHAPEPLQICPWSNLTVLPNGNVLLADVRVLYEVDQHGKMIWDSHDWDADGLPLTIRLPNGNYLAPREEKIVELDPSGKKVQEHNMTKNLWFVTVLRGSN